MTYIHPNVSSTIIDNSVTYITSEGTTKLFAVFVAEKGPDNKIQTITSASEFIFNYGEPDLRYYGQAPYNVLEWLKGGGEAYTLRVLPDDAQYANAFVNIQTKKTIGTKEVNLKDAYGKNVGTALLDDVYLRPVVLYSTRNNQTIDALTYNELMVDRDKDKNYKTLDGYDNHLLFTVVSRGRSDAYNKLGFRITLNDSYDTTYDFRLYNFEVMQVNDIGDLQTIEGPFVVSFDPDAKNVAGESMFIEYVVNNYSEHLNVIFNDKEFDKLGAIINPNVNPNKIDFLTGETRLINNIEHETYYEEKTEQNEDIHISLIPYAQGEPIEGEKNIADPSDAIEATLVLTDNDYRKNRYLFTSDQASRIRNVYSMLRKNQFSILANNYYRYIDESESATEDSSLKIASRKLLQAINDYRNNSVKKTVNPDLTTQITVEKFVDTNSNILYVYTDTAEDGTIIKYEYDAVDGTLRTLTKDIVNEYKNVLVEDTAAAPQYYVTPDGSDYVYLTTDGQYKVDSTGNVYYDAGSGELVYDTLDSSAFWKTIYDTENPDGIGLTNTNGTPVLTAFETNPDGTVNKPAYTYTETVHDDETDTDIEVTNYTTDGSVSGAERMTVQTPIMAKPYKKVFEVKDWLKYDFSDKDNLDGVKLAGDKVIAKIGDFLELAKTAYSDIYLVRQPSQEQTLTSYLNVDSDINEISKRILYNDKTTLSIISARDIFSTLDEQFNDAQADGSEAALIKFYSKLYSESDKLLSKLNSLDEKEFHIYDYAEDNEFVAAFNDLNNQLLYINDDFMPVDTETRSELFRAAKEDAEVILEQAKIITLQIQIEVILKVLKDVAGSVPTAEELETNSYGGMIKSLTENIDTVISAAILDSDRNITLEVLRNLIFTNNKVNQEKINKLQEDIALYDLKIQEVGNYYYTLYLQNFNNGIQLQFGSCGSIAIGAENRDTIIDQLLIKGYEGLIDDSLIDKDKWQIDIVLDANYSLAVKRAIVDLTTNLRGDFIALLDCGLNTPTPAATLAYRNSSLNYNNFRISVWSQNFVINESAYSGKSLQVTAPFFLASKIIKNDNTNGIYTNFVGPRRGILEGFSSINFNPNSEWKERLYKAQINYVEQTYQTTKFATQLTAQYARSALSYITNVRCLLKIQRDVEKMMEVYIQERNIDATYSAAQAQLNAYLASWESNGACSSIKGVVYASAYDVAQNIMRVKIEMKFVGVIERIAIDLVVNS